MKTVIEMAREAGFAIDVSTDPNSPPSWWGAGHDDRFKAFAELVRADEREECAKYVDHILKEGGGTYGDAIRARSCPPCNEDCEQGRNCPLRSNI